jgi:hypothetical protein
VHGTCNRFRSNFTVVLLFIKILGVILWALDAETTILFHAAVLVCVPVVIHARCRDNDAFLKKKF